MENENINPAVEKPVVEEPIAPQVPPDPEKKSNIYRILFIALGIFILLGVIIGIYFMLSGKIKEINTENLLLNPTPTVLPTAKNEKVNWKNYINITYKYSIQFPDTYGIAVKTDEEISRWGIDNNVCLKPKNEEINDSSACFLIIDVLPESFSEVVKAKTAENNPGPVDTEVGPYKGKMFVYKQGESTDQVVTILPNYSNLKQTMSFTYYHYPTEIEREKLISEILSKITFFGEGNRVVNGDTFTDLNGGYIIKIPEGWQSGSPDRVVFINPEEQMSTAYPSSISISYGLHGSIFDFKIEDEQVFQKWLKENPSAVSKRIFKVKNLKVDNLDAIQFSYKTLPEDETEIYTELITWVRYNNLNYYINLTLPEDIVGSNDAYNLILTSLKFIY